MPPACRHLLDGFSALRSGFKHRDTSVDLLRPLVTPHLCIGVMSVREAMDLADEPGAQSSTRLTPGPEERGRRTSGALRSRWRSMGTSIQDYEKLEKIGAGTYGKVRLQPCATHSGSLSAVCTTPCTFARVRPGQAVRRAPQMPTCTRLNHLLSVCMCMQVYMAKHRRTGEIVAHKKIKLGVRLRPARVFACVRRTLRTPPPAHLLGSALSPERWWSYVAHVAAPERREVHALPRTLSQVDVD